MRDDQCVEHDPFRGVGAMSELQGASRVRRGLRSGQRLSVADVLRGIAIVAMLVAHAGPFFPDASWLVHFCRDNLNDLASPLFVLVMGMSAQIVRNRGGSLGTMWARQALRGGILIALGMWMATWGSWVAIVLQPLGLLLIFGVPLLLLGTRVLSAVALALVLLSQPLLTLARDAMWVHSHSFLVREFANWAALGTSYRLVNLLPFFLLGALLLRHGFKRDGLLWAMAAVAPVAYVARAVAEKMLWVQDVRSGDYLDTLHDVGLVFAVYVVIVLVSTARASAIRKGWEAVSLPFQAWGQLALSLYVLHVGLIALWARANGMPTENTYLGWLLVVPGVALIGLAWWRWVGTGPVEWVMGLVTGRRKKLRTAGERSRYDMSV